MTDNEFSEAIQQRFDAIVRICNGVIAERDKLREEAEKEDAYFKTMDESYKIQIATLRRSLSEAYGELARCEVWEHWDDEMVTSFCGVCGGRRDSHNGCIVHKPDCIVLTAQKARDGE
jgi:hypothetical protein